MSLRTRNGEVASRIAESLLLLVGRIVFFIDDDESGLRERREDGRAGADHDAGSTAARTAPCGQALRIIEGRVQHGKRCGETIRKPLRQLRRQRDLGHQHQCAAPGRERMLDRVQIDLGLAAAGDAM